MGDVVMAVFQRSVSARAGCPVQEELAHLAAGDGDVELDKLHVTLKSFYLERFALKGTQKLG